MNRYTKSSFKPSPGCTACSPAHILAVAVLPPPSLAALMNVQQLGRAQPSHFPQCIVGHEKLYLKLFHSYSLKENMYFLTKSFIQILCLIFLKFFGRVAFHMDEQTLSLTQGTSSWSLADFSSKILYMHKKISK